MTEGPASPEALSSIDDYIDLVNKRAAKELAEIDSRGNLAASTPCWWADTAGQMKPDVPTTEKQRNAAVANLYTIDC